VVAVERGYGLEKICMEIKRPMAKVPPVKFIANFGDSYG